MSQEKVQCTWCNARFVHDRQFQVGIHFDCPFCKEPLKVVRDHPEGSISIEKAPEDYFEDPEFSVRSRFRRGGWL